MNLPLKSALLASTMMLVPTAAWAQSQEEDETQIDTSDIEEVVVQGTFIPDEKRATSEVANVLDSESFQRAGDGDVAVALTRVTGLSLFQGKFVFVRGLGERYSSVLLENALFPSTDPLRRVVALDILPTSLVENVLVQKTFSPSFPAEFGGGTINIRTKAVPDEFILEVGANIGFNTVSTFATGFVTDRNSSEFTSFRGSNREIPDGLLDVPFDGVVPEAVAESLFPNFSVDEEPNHPNGGFNVTFGNGWDVGERRIGVLVSGGWDTQIVNKNGIRTVIPIEGTDPNQDFSPEACLGVDPNTPQDIVDDCGRRNTEETFALNGLISLGLEWDSQNAFKLTSVLLRNSVTESLIQTGIFAADPDSIRTFVRNDFIETNVWTTQLSGNHEWNIFGNSDVFLGTQVDWRVTYYNTDRDAPLRRELNFQFFPADDEFRLLAAPNLNETNFSALDDESIEFGYDILQPVSIGQVAADIKFGFNYADRNRSSATRRFNYQGLITASEDVLALVPELIFSPANIGPTGFSLEDSTAGSDAFEAGLESIAVYGQIDAQITPELRIAAGLRYEDSEQTSDTAEFIIGLGVPDPINIVQNVDRLLPSATITYEFVENVQLRLGYSQTLSRPDLRELSNALFIDPQRDTLVIGNPGVLVDTDGDGVNDTVDEALEPSIFDNFDLRLEWYFGLGEQASIGVFYKDIENPIEQSFGFRAGTLLQSFDNADGAELFGIEAEIEKILDFQNWFGWDWLGDRVFLLKLNGTYVDAEVSFGDSFGSIFPTNTVRRLQGQSDLLGNIQFGWENIDAGETFNLALNYTSDRIFTVGVNGAPDTFEEPPILLNINYKRLILDNLELQVAIDNILGDEFILRAGDVLSEEYDIGRTFTIGLTYSF